MAHILRIISTVVTAVSAVRAAPGYAIPASFPQALLASDDCYLPVNYTVDQLMVWMPSPSNTNQNETADFRFTDLGTNIDTFCHKNSSSPNVGGVDDAPRYACDNNLVLFILQNGTLTLIEKVCGGSTGFQASGSLKPGFNCVPTDPTLPAGEGFNCTAADSPLNGNFTSMQPAPPSPSPPGSLA